VLRARNLARLVYAKRYSAGLGERPNASLEARRLRR
jgi:hypothetical protein